MTERAIALRAFVADIAGFDVTDATLDGALFGAGVLDSLNLLNVVSFVEQLWSIRVPAGDLTLEHWDTLTAIEAYAGRSIAS